MDDRWMLCQRRSAVHPSPITSQVHPSLPFPTIPHHPYPSQEASPGVFQPSVRSSRWGWVGSHLGLGAGTTQRLEAEKHPKKYKPDGMDEQRGERESLSFNWLICLSSGLRGRGGHLSSHPLCPTQLSVEGEAWGSCPHTISSYHVLHQEERGRK